LLWNSFNFCSTNTQCEDQYKIDVGVFNPLLGKSYGEIAALSRSQHKSQGFGVPAQRGSVIEYFATIKGDKPVNNLMDGIAIGWKRLATSKNENDKDIFQALIDSIITNYSMLHPENSITQLVHLYRKIEMSSDEYWKPQKLKEITAIIEACGGLFLEATTSNQYAVQGDSFKIMLTAVNRLGVGQIF